MDTNLCSSQENSCQVKETSTDVVICKNMSLSIKQAQALSVSSKRLAPQSAHLFAC
jgi:hypothetical protein